MDILKNQKQLGAALLGVGLLLTVMGMMLFFEGNLLRLGNVSLNFFYNKYTVSCCFSPAMRN
jgi:hypothetical protein